MTLRVALALALAAAAVWPAGPAARLGACPTDVRPLAAAPSAAERAEATAAALRFARTSYAPRANFVVDRMGVTDVRWARGWPAAHFVLSSCGAVAWSGTLVVSVVFPVMFDKPPRPFGSCDFCAGVVLLVARGAGGWFVWDAL
jgi:hypothetical protein